jgi:hypothetical protein
VLLFDAVGPATIGCPATCGGGRVTEACIEVEATISRLDCAGVLLAVFAKPTLFLGPPMLRCVNTGEETGIVATDAVEPWPVRTTAAGESAPVWLPPPAIHTPGLSEPAMLVMLCNLSGPGPLAVCPSCALALKFEACKRFWRA